MDFVDEIIAMFDEKGEEAYFGEEVSQKAHALQSAFFAREEGAVDRMVAAALLHDIGHLAHDLPEEIADQGVDTLHEELGERMLSQYFDQDITEPILLHVDAKRYLCKVESGYLEHLSDASRQSLQLQGGAFREEEAKAFELNPYFKQAVMLRHWDDEAKVPDLDVPALETYIPLLRAALRKN